MQAYECGIGYALVDVEVNLILVGWFTVKTDLQSRQPLLGPAPVVFHIHRRQHICMTWN